MNSIKRRVARRNKRHDKQTWKKEVEVEIRIEEIDRGVSGESAERKKGSEIT